MRTPGLDHGNRGVLRKLMSAELTNLPVPADKGLGRASLGTWPTKTRMTHMLTCQPRNLCSGGSDGFGGYRSWVSFGSSTCESRR